MCTSFPFERRFSANALPILPRPKIPTRAISNKSRRRLSVVKKIRLVAAPGSFQVFLDFYPRIIEAFWDDAFFAQSITNLPLWLRLPPEQARQWQLA